MLFSPNEIFRIKIMTSVFVATSFRKIYEGKNETANHAPIKVVSWFLLSIQQIWLCHWLRLDLSFLDFFIIEDFSICVLHCESFIYKIKCEICSLVWLFPWMKWMLFNTRGLFKNLRFRVSVVPFQKLIT